MNEQRRARRIPLHLPVELRRGGWESMLTENISRRGLFLRSVGPCPTGQLLRLRVTVPGLEAPLDMMATVARRVESATALRHGLLPGIGMEFFCLKDRALRLWEEFVLGLQRRRVWEEMESPWALTRQLLEGTAPSIPLEPLEKQADAAAGGEEPAGQEMAKAEQPADEERSSLILRMTTDELERLAHEQLPTGRIDIHIPYRMDEGALVSVRFVHPVTEEEVLLPGMLRSGSEREQYQIELGAQAPGALDEFRRFLRTGLPGLMVQGGSRGGDVSVRGGT